jgi:GDP-L-fucose synthase
VKKLLITGAAGLLGSACVREFGKDHEIVPCKGIDLTQVANVRGLFEWSKPDMVIHCAAKVGGVKANRDFPVDFMLQNLKMQTNVLEAAHDYGVRRLCFVATSCMFPKDTALPVQETSLFTGRLEDSVEAYAIAKIAGWRLCKAYWEQYQDRFITVAPSNIYGPNDNYSESAHVIPALIRKFHEAVQTKVPMEVWGDGSAVREFIYSDDVAAAIRLLLALWKSPEVVNIGTAVGTSIQELVYHIGLQSPYPKSNWPTVQWNKNAPTGIPRKTFSIENLEALGWKPKHSLSEGLKQTWNDFLKGTPRGM